jgi:hypothetical protein
MELKAQHAQHKVELQEKDMAMAEVKTRHEREMEKIRMKHTEEVGQLEANGAVLTQQAQKQLATLEQQQKQLGQKAKESVVGAKEREQEAQQLVQQYEVRYRYKH